MMRVRNEQGHIVEMVHFRWNLRNLELLQELQRQPDTCNMYVAVQQESSRTMIALFRLNLDVREVMNLNPHPTSVRRAS